MGIAAAFTALVAGVAVVPNASAGAVAGPSSDEIAQSVYSAPDAAIAFAALSEHQQVMFAARTSQWKAVEVETRTSKVTPTKQQLKAMGPSTAAGGCWYVYKYHDWYDVWIKTGSTWMTATWCSNGSTITSYNLSGQGGQGYKGIKYEGLGSKYVHNVGWEVRQAQQFKFNLGWANFNPCMQIRGGATGLYSFQPHCNLG
ncbi:hypothetical protein [Streptomyces sp. SID13031]|uniref:hypothetical protein n=1 Tax=Streptomyces sp. SID13031 TaxID=2706046 RepID=UPI0013C7C6B4|nr:hypothetical protein [Streptomyces sp. SID13031]NEA35743.1 hypothetical protein [Streptomyces sp. SID13031]